MIEINLLKKAEDYKDIEAIKISVSPVEFLVKIVLLILFIVPLSYYETYSINVLKETNKELKVRIAKISDLVGEKKENISEAEKVSKKIDALEAREQILIDLAKKRSQLIRILDHFQNVIPDKIWFRSLNYSTDEVRIKGYSIDNENILNFVKSLENGGHLESVNLERSFYSKSGNNAEILEFELVCLLRVG